MHPAKAARAATLRFVAPRAPMIVPNRTSPHPAKLPLLSLPVVPEQQVTSLPRSPAVAEGGGLKVARRRPLGRRRATEHRAPAPAAASLPRVRDSARARI